MEILGYSRIYHLARIHFPAAVLECPKSLRRVRSHSGDSVTYEHISVVVLGAKILTLGIKFGGDKRPGRQNTCRVNDLGVAKDLGGKRPRGQNTGGKRPGGKRPEGKRPGGGGGGKPKAPLISP